VSTIQPFDFSVNLLSALLWQYNDALRLQGLLEQKQTWYNTNQTAFWGDWTTDVFDLHTSSSFGCSVWAVILDLPLFLTAGEDPPGFVYWGFALDDENFDNGNFSNAGGAGLTLEQKRTILQLRYFQLTTRGAVPEINAFLAYLFGDQGRAYVVDSLTMSLLYVFEFDLPFELQTILTQYDLLPRPAGVGVGYTIVVPEGVWGFALDDENFDNGSFDA